MAFSVVRLFGLKFGTGSTQFNRMRVSGRIQASICTACDALIGCAESPAMLSIAESAHQCTGATFEELNDAVHPH